MTTNYVVFVSYTHDDDAYENGGITKLAERLERSIRAYTGQKDLQVFFDQKSIEWGEAWRERIADGLAESTILITIMTPTFFVSQECRHELEDFLSQPDRKDWLLPIYYIDVPDLGEREDPVSNTIRERQYEDWRELRMATPSSKKVRKGIEHLATRIRDLLKATLRSESAMTMPEPMLEYRAQATNTTNEDVDWFDYAMEANALSDIEEFGLARAVLTEALAQFADEADLIFELATVDWYDGWLEQAAAGFEKALKSGIDRLDVLQCLGQVHIELGDYEVGVNELTEVIEKHSDPIAKAYARSTRAVGLAVLGNHNTALDELNSAERETPRNAWVHFNRGLVLDSNGDPSAIRCYVNSLVFNDPPLNRPKRLMVLERLAEVEWHT